MKSSILNTPEHKRSATWAKLRGAAATGRSAKRIIHRRERHETRRQLRDAISTKE